MPTVLLTPAYPSDFPFDAARVLVDVVRKASDYKSGVQAGWILLGYGLGSFLPTPQVFGHKACGDDECEDVLCKHLEPLLVAHASGDTHKLKFVALPWSVLIPLIIQVVEKWLVK